MAVVSSCAISVAVSALLIVSGSPARGQRRPVVPAAQADTTRPRVPSDLNLPEDSALVVAAPDDTVVLYFRNIVAIAFVEHATGRAVRAVLQKYNAVIIGGDPNGGPWGEYIVRIPDPGPSLTALSSLVARIEAEPAVAEASWVTFRDKFVPRTLGSSRMSADTVWPVLTTLPLLDTSRVVSLDTFLLFRTDITLRFKLGVSDSAKRAFFDRHSMTVVGVTKSGMFYVRIPDPGTPVEHLWDALDALRVEPEVDIVTYIPWTSMPEANPSADTSSGTATHRLPHRRTPGRR